MNGTAKKSNNRRVGDARDAEKKMRGSSVRVGNVGGLIQEVTINPAPNFSMQHYRFSPAQRKFSTSIISMSAWSSCVYKIHCPSGDTLSPSGFVQGLNGLASGTISVTLPVVKRQPIRARSRIEQTRQGL